MVVREVQHNKEAYLSGYHHAMPQEYCKANGLQEDHPSHPIATGSGASKKGDGVQTRPGKSAAAASCSKATQSKRKKEEEGKDGEEEKESEADIEEAAIPYVTRFPSKKEVRVLSSLHVFIVPELILSPMHVKRTLSHQVLNTSAICVPCGRWSVLPSGKAAMSVGPVIRLHGVKDLRHGGLVIANPCQVDSSILLCTHPSMPAPSSIYP